MSEQKESSVEMQKAWGMKDKEGNFFYALQNGFGIVHDKYFKNTGRITKEEDFQVYGDCNSDEWYEIAQQLFAIKQGWAELPELE